jgi:predicted PhzF superfamily epimerase YddE/YHI9
MWYEGLKTPRTIFFLFWARFQIYSPLVWPCFADFQTGHATLATAHVLFNEAKLVKGDLVLFETQSGVLKVRRNETELELDFPRGYPLHFEMDHLILEQITACFGLTADSVLAKAFCTQTKKMILELDKPSNVWAATVPDAKMITSIPYPLDVRGIAITCGSQSDGWKSEMMQAEVEKSSIEAQSLDSPSLEKNRHGITPEQAIKLRGCDFMTRYFSPWNGIPEDPVNGSSHTLLPYYYSSKLNKTCMKSHAASSRGGYLRLTIDAEQKDRIFIAGNATTVLQGTLRL